MTTTYTSKYANGAAVDAALDKAGTAVQPDDLGTAAALDVPATGNADTDEVVLGSDTRLSDARTPTAHGHAVAVPTGEGQADGYMSYQDKAKLNGIESGATADQTAQEIATLIDADATAESTLKSALGLGSAAYTASTAYATASQGSKADSALQAGDIEDTPVDGHTTKAASSNWAYDHAASTQAHGVSGTVVGTSDTQTLTNKTITNYKEGRYATTTNADITLNLANGNVQRLILDANRQITLPADPGDVGQSFVLIIECATFTPTWNSSPTIEWLTSDGNAPTLVTTANLVNVLTFIWDDVDSRWLGFLAGKES